jgi:hypothetical protein
MSVNAQFLGSTRVSGVGFGVAPKPTLTRREDVPSCEPQRKVRDREGALATPRDACAPQT